MPKIMEIIAKETNGKSYHTYKYSYDSIGVPSIDYDDDPNKVMKWKDSGETSSPITPIDLKSLADKLQVVGEKPLRAVFRIVIRRRNRACKKYDHQWQSGLLRARPVPEAVRL